MTTTRGLHTSTLLLSGQVLVAGGYNTTRVAGAELYDPGSGTWKVTGSLYMGRNSQTATLLPNGRVLIAGGYSTDYLSFAELY